MKVSKSEALRRSIQLAAKGKKAAVKKLTPLEALEKLQKHGIDPAAADANLKELREERIACEEKRLRR